MKISKKLLPMKGHYFLFNAGTAPLVPYLSTYAKQLGFTSATVGLIYTVLPIFGLIAKPLFGVIADRFKIQKPIFLLFQILTIVSFSLIYVIPEAKSNARVELDCGDGVTMIRSCFKSEDYVDTCKVDQLGNTEAKAKCHMNCDMTSPMMWQTVCEHWHIPEYCYSSTDNIKYNAVMTEVKAQDNCVLIGMNNITLDGLSFAPKCRVGFGDIDVEEPCSLNCTSDELSIAIGNNTANMTCVDKTFHYKYCGESAVTMSDVGTDIENSECQASCDLDETKPWKLMEICEGLGADMAETCRPKTKFDEPFPKNLSFVADVLLQTTLSQNECVYIQLIKIQLPNGATHFPICISKAQYQVNAELFHASCEISCNDAKMMELVESAAESREVTTQYTRQFWLFFLLMTLSWIGQAVVVTFADAICFNLLGAKTSNYGKQRLWGSVGWGIFSLVTGALIDSTSDGAYKNYAIAFILMFVFMTGDVIVSCLLKIETTKISVNIVSDVGALFSSLPTFVFMLWTVAVGLSTGLIWQFLFWHLEDIHALNCTDTDYSKTLQGLVSAIQMFCGEIPFMFVSGYILRKLGHVNTMSLVLFAFGVRFILYSYLTNPWWVLPIEMLQGITFGMFYPTMTSYANIVALPGTETTVQGVVGAIFEGVGTSLGSFIGGRLYETYGGWNTFRWFGMTSLIFCSLHILVQLFLRRRTTEDATSQGYSSVIKYEQPNDSVHILEEMTDDCIYQ